MTAEASRCPLAPRSTPRATGGRRRVVAAEGHAAPAPARRSRTMRLTEPYKRAPQPTRPDAQHRFGSAVAFVADVNDDGVDDALVGASHDEAGDTQPGQVFLFLGGPTW